MKQLSFPPASYTFKEGSYIYDKTDSSIVAPLELLWTVIQESPLQDLKRADHRTNIALKKAIREITIFKDKDKDSRISINPQILVLEDAQFELLKRHLNANIFSSRVSEDVETLWNIIESAKEYEIPRPQLVRETKSEG